MKKSDIYRVAQVAVMQYPLMNSTEKLEVLRELMDREDLEKFIEQENAHETF